jgi:hypothetical protein
MSIQSRSPRNGVHEEISRSGSPPSALTEKVADDLFVIDDDMQVRARHGHITVARGRPDLGQRTSAREGVADERVMDG